MKNRRTISVLLGITAGALLVTTLVARAGLDEGELGDGCSGFPCGNDGDKVLICHVPPGNPAKARTLCITPGKRVAEHLANHEGDHC